MSRSIEETRRDFLVRLARTAVLVAPAVVTLDTAPLAAQGGKSTKAATTTGSTVGSLTPTSGAAVQQQLPQSEPAGSTLPWDPASSEPAPWTVPPPTSTG